MPSTPSSQPLITFMGEGRNRRIILTGFYPTHPTVDVPLSHLSDADLELEGLAPVQARVELGSVLQGPSVVHGQEVATLGLLLAGVGLLEVVDLQARVLQ